jgi:hypothetical protein
MKIKTILITAVLVIGAGTATSYFVRRSHESNIVKVEVVPVTSVNNAAYSMGDSSTVSGTIISKDTQVVALDSSHELKNVYVQQGDRVKKGDKLLEYDMLGDELKEEMEELTKMGLELTLESMKKDLETLKSGRMPESMGGGESGYSTSMDSDDDDDGADEDDGDDDAGSAANVDASGRSHVNAGVTKQGGGAVGAADTLAQKPLTLAGAYSKPAAKQTQKPAGKLPSTPVWTPSTFLHALQQLQEDMQEGMQEETSDPADGILKSEGDEIVSDDSSLLPAESWDDLLPENEESVDAPLTASDLFDTSDQETVQSVIPDAIAADEESVADALIGDEDIADTTTIQDGIFDEEGNGAGDEADAPALASSLSETDPAETDPALISAMEEENPEGTDSASLSAAEEDETYESDSTETTTPPPAITPETNFEGDVLIEDEEEVVGESLDIIAEINNFLSQVNNITLAVDSDWNTIGSQISAINAAIDKFRNSFAQSSEHETTDLFGENVIVTAYAVSPEVISQVGQATASVMQTAYERLCAYHFIHTMLSLNPDSSDSASVDPTWASANEAAVKAAVNELASLPQDMWLYNPATNSIEFRDLYSGMNQALFSGESMIDFLRGAALKVNENYVLEEPTNINPEISTEGKIWTTPAPSGDDGDDGLGYTAEELAEAIKEQEKNIKETELQIREAELGIKEHKKILEGKIVYATMDGIVKSAGTLESASGNSFITITGKAGLYVKGSVNELALDTVKVGNTITGTSYETGSTFTAEIVEISEYPEDSSNNFYGYGDGNTNSSYYPFLAYIENADGLEVDSYVDLSLSGSSASSYSDPMLSDGLSLEEYFIRTDNNGRSYCFVRGEDGLLEKRYLEVGANNWGTITIKSGLTPRDCIAFPYGDGVEEGAQTVEVEYLTAVEGEDF